MRPLSPGEPGWIGRYRLLAVLGEGGMGRVLLGVAPDGRLVALKQVHPRLAQDPGFRERFRREVAASRMVSGAYTAAVVDAGPDAPVPWLASVFVAGPSLAEAIDAAGPLPPLTVRHLAAGLASALAEIHRAGLVHRDLKPSNVLLTDDGPRVIDFGIARAMHAVDGTELTHTGAIIGSPSYLSPEQASGGPLTSASDVFSLGTLLVMAATGRNPFTGASVPQTLYHIVHLHPDLATLPAELRRVVEPCLAKDPAARPSPAQILETLGPIPPLPRPWPLPVHTLIERRQAAAREAVINPPKPGPAKPRRRGVTIALAAIAAVLLAGGSITAAILLTGDDSAAPAPAVGAAPPSAVPAANPDPLGPDRLREVNPCEVLPSVPEIGTLTPRIDVHFFSCTYQTERGQWIDLTIGDNPPDGSVAGELEGLPLTVEENASGCTAAVPVTDRPDTTISAVASSSGPSFENPCEAASTVLGEAIRRIRAGQAGSGAPPESIARVDPCALLDRTAAQQIIGPVIEMEPDGLHECEYQASGRLTLALARGLRPSPQNDPYYDWSGPIDLNGVTAFMTRKRDSPTSAWCEVSWQHRPLAEDESEKVTIAYSTSGSTLTLTDDEVCGRARDFAAAIMPKLPKP